MKRYYDRRRTPAPVLAPGDRVFLDASDITTSRPSKKLSHRRLGPFQVERRVGSSAYKLRLPRSMSRLHPVFNVVKLLPAPEDPIIGRKVTPPPDPIIEEGHEEWEVEQVLNSRTHRNRLQYLIKWKGFGLEHNSWEAASDVFAPDLVAEFHRHHPGAPRRIRACMFNSIPFRSLTPSRRDLEGGVNVRGLPNIAQFPEPSPNPSATSRIGSTLNPLAAPSELTRDRPIG